MKKLLPALMLFLLLCAMCLSSLAEGVPYIYYTWDNETKVLTRHDGTCTTATPLTNDMTELR